MNLLEVADLNALLKSRLNISDAPVMVAGGGAVASAPKEEVCMEKHLLRNIMKYCMEHISLETSEIVIL